MKPIRDGRISATNLPQHKGGDVEFEILAMLLPELAGQILVP